MGWWCVVGSSGLGYEYYIVTKLLGFLTYYVGNRYDFVLVLFAAACAFVTSILVGRQSTIIYVTTPHGLGSRMYACIRITRGLQA